MPEKNGNPFYNVPLMENRVDQDSEPSRSWKRRLVKTVSTNNNERQE